MREPIGRRPWAAGLSCAGVYREPTCADAWRDAFDASGGPETARPEEEAAKILAACARAYCPRLSPAPAACAVGGGGGGATLDEVARLVELDGAILAYEGAPVALARALAGRGKLLVSVSATIESTPPVPRNLHVR